MLRIHQIHASHVYLSENTTDSSKNKLTNTDWVNFSIPSLMSSTSFPIVYRPFHNNNASLQYMESWIRADDLSPWKHTSLRLLPLFIEGTRSGGLAGLWSAIAIAKASPSIFNRGPMPLLTGPDPAVRETSALRRETERDRERLRELNSS